jgi:Fic family protein
VVILAIMSQLFLPFNEHLFGQQTAELDYWKRSLDTGGSLVVSWDGRLRRDLEAAAVAASTSMEGVAVTVDEVRRILVGDRPESVSAEDAELVSGYRDAMKYVQRRADDDAFAWSSELIKGIHDRVLAGNFANGAGRYGAGRWVADATTGNVVFEPPPDKDVPRLIDLACERMSTWSAHPALRSAWVHVALAAIHPFKDGNGRTARVLSSLAMYRDGFKRPEFCSLEEWWGRHRTSYYEAFKCLGSGFRTSTDVTAFVSAHVSAQVSQVRAIDLKERVDRRIWLGLELLCDRNGLARRSTNALWDGFYGRAIRPMYYRKLVDVGEVAATSDLRRMKAAGLLDSTGQTRARRYVGTENLFSQLADVLTVPKDAASREGIIAQLIKYAPVAVYANDSATATESSSIVEIPSSSHFSAVSEGRTTTTSG